MSRIGRLPIAVPAGVTVTISEDNLVTVKGPKGELKQQVNPDITVKQEGGQLLVVAARDEPQEIVLIVFVEDDLYGVGVVRVLHVPLETQGLTNTQIVPYEVGIVVLAAS